MKLELRRKIAQLQDETLPGRVQEIADICGQAIPYEVDWDSFSDDLEGLGFLDFLSCHRLNMALRAICIDDLGRAAVRDGLRQVRLSNAPDAKAMHLRFEDGVLDMRCAYRLNTAGMYDDRAIYRALMEKL